MEQNIKKLKDLLFEYGPKVISALIILVVGLWIIKMITKGAKQLMVKRNLDESLQGFFGSLIGWGLKIFLFITVAGQLGVETTSFAAIIAALGLAIGMALQGALSNFAGGALIMVFKPFKIGDYIEAQGEQGTVKEIQIFTTKLNSIDNREIIVPNGILSNGNIVNYSSEENRRVDLVFGVSYDADIKETKNVLLSVLNNTPYTLNTPAPAVMVSELADSSVNFTTRTWVKSADYWNAHFHIIENVKIALDKAGIEIPYPHAVEIQKEA
ncbi:mechanosensitive ion channel family protein [Tenacibaculum piscium]|uniref:mechanosensitive ion channel family protein n=1 Tax=Tenacibaculum piscium TaxID=1458515 RepID=UPI001F25662F|nr:mechanosensitive ion channel domain-containing protein [Tenacibaculum piscium]